MNLARTDLLPHRGGDAWVLVDPLTDRVHRLNVSAYWIWLHCDGQTTEQALAGMLAEEAGIPLSRAADEIARTVQALREMKLLEQSSPCATSIS